MILSGPIDALIRALPAFVISAIIIAFAPSASADCQGVGEKGSCRGLNVVQWCDNGELKEATCPEGEICAMIDDRYTCLPKSYTDCKDIPDEGVCTSGGNAVWCVDGAVKIKECEPDELCTIVDQGWADCVPEARMLPQSDVMDAPDDAGDGTERRPDGSASADVGPDQAEEEGGADAANPTPPVVQGEPYTWSEPEGCAASKSTAPGVMLFAVLFGCLLWLRRTGLA